MDDKLYLLICDKFKKETERIGINPENDGMEFRYYSTDYVNCNNKSDELYEQMIASGYSSDNVILLSREMETERKVDHTCDCSYDSCLNLLSGNELLEYLSSKGCFLMTSGWLKEWKHNILDVNGFGPESAHSYFSKSYSKVVLIDSGVDESITSDLIEFSEFIGLEYETINVGMDRFSSTVMNIFRNWKLRKLEYTMHSKSRQVTDYALVFDFLEKKATLLKRDDLIQNIFVLFEMLTGAKKLAFLPITDQKRGELVFYHKDYHSELYDIDKFDFEQTYRITSTGTGFIFKITFDNDIMGYMEVENILFPNYLDNYLDLSKTIMVILGILLFNSKIYEKLIRTNEELLLFNTTLEQLVKERTSQLLDANRNLEEANCQLEEEIAEHKRIENELIQAKLEADMANAAKSNFLSNMSHEIRTPMNGIIGMTNLALMMSADEEQRSYLNLVLESTNSLVHIINDILDYTMIEAGKMSIENKTFNLRDVINEIMLLFNITAVQKKLVLNCQVDMNIPELLIGDIVRLRQIISNLVGNAIKFTKHGSIELKIEIIDRTSSNVKLLFSVADTGIGISEEQQKLLFGNFVQLDSTYSKNYQGTGLGLAISKKLVELMNGEIWCESELGFGSTFYFSLDLAVHTDKRSDRNEVPDNNDRELSFRQKKVLIADDDRISREIIVKLLEKRGVYVLTASDGRQAVEIFRKEKLDVVLLDVQMPDFNGISTVRAIRGIEVGTGTHTPVIAFTAYLQMLDKEELLKAGMDDYLGKPIEIREFYDKMDQYLSMKNNQ